MKNKKFESIAFLQKKSNITLPLGYMDKEEIKQITNNNIQSGRVIYSEYSSLFNSESLCALPAKPISKIFNL
jgi:hypothetical protein